MLEREATSSRLGQVVSPDSSRHLSRCRCSQIYPSEEGQPLKCSIKSTALDRVKRTP